MKGTKIVHGLAFAGVLVQVIQYPRQKPALLA